MEGWCFSLRDIIQVFLYSRFLIYFSNPYWLSAEGQNRTADTGIFSPHILDILRFYFLLIPTFFS